MKSLHGNDIFIPRSTSHCDFPLGENNVRFSITALYNYKNRKYDIVLFENLPQYAIRGTEKDSITNNLINQSMANRKFQLSGRAKARAFIHLGKLFLLVLQEMSSINLLLINLGCRYDEVCSPGYPFGSAQSPGGAGHFTQVVWSDSTELGIGKGTSQKGGMKCTYVVARYKPLGNFNTGNDDYNKNVKRGENFDEDKYCSGQKPSWFDAPLKQLGRPDSEKLQGFRLVEESRDINVSKKAKVLKKRPHPRQKIWRHKKVKTHV